MKLVWTRQGARGGANGQTSCDHTTQRSTPDTNPSTQQREAGSYVSIRSAQLAHAVRAGGRGRRYLALGGVAVEAGLGCPVAPAFAVVHVHGEVEVEEVAFHDGVCGGGLCEHGWDECWTARAGYALCALCSAHGGDERLTRRRGCWRRGGRLRGIGGICSWRRGGRICMLSRDKMQKCKNAKN